MRLAAICAALALPCLAHARPITAGAGVGRIQSKVDANGSADNTLELFARASFTNRLGAQLEIMRISPDTGDSDMKTFTGLLVVDLAPNPHFVPLLVAGFGIDRASTYSYEATGTHTEGGLGLEYRHDGGLTVGFDVRLGGRSIDSDTMILYDNADQLYQPATLHAGEYRSARLTAAIRF